MMTEKIRFFRTKKGGWDGYDVEVPEEYETLKSFLTYDVCLHPYSCRGLLLWIDAVLDGRTSNDSWGGNSCFAHIYPDKTLIQSGFSEINFEDPTLEKLSTKEFRDIIQKCLDFNIQQGRDITDEEIRYQIEEFNHALEKKHRKDLCPGIKRLIMFLAVWHGLLF
ncbi:MAG: hypothetical protein OHK0012_10340 [Synechococcales cyanobacterium]